MRCTAPLHFNRQLNVCDYEWRAGCSKNSLNTTTTTEPATVCPPQNGKFPVFLPHTENCSLYYVCDNGLPKLMRCPSPLHFNRQLNVCDYEWRAGCSKNDHLSSIKPEVTNSSSTNVADRTGYTDSPFSNTSLGYTVQPNNNRTEVIISSKDDIVNNTTISVIDGNRTIEAESTTHRSLKTTTTEPATVCPPKNGKFPVFLPHTENCSLYYVCDNGLPKLMRCPAPLHFNRQLNVCDYEWRAGCFTN
ncbi:chondroitin proteoglycan 1-like, partial [Limulus polyphemus]|uniref:Chondroitin proteoglycan 1-like n=1 Tax=Limulus polyphemus TaxID=6850 RepID=A0ABM1TS16_LIMPO